MKCRQHPHEIGVGVCASCLRERLFTVIAARSAAASSSSQDDRRHPHLSYVEPEQPSPQSLPLARSASPYFSRIRSDVSNVGRFPNAQSGTSPGAGIPSAGKFSAFSTIISHHRSDNSHQDHGPAARICRLSSWFPSLRDGLLKRRDRKKKEIGRSISLDVSPVVAEESAGTFPVKTRPRSSLRRSNRGMSPDEGDSTPESDYITDSQSPRNHSWRPTPPPLRQRPTAEHQHHFSAGLAGFSVCLSPLMSPSRTRRRSHVRAETSGVDLPRTLSPLHHQPHGHASVGRSSLGATDRGKRADSSKFK